MGYIVQWVGLKESIVAPRGVTVEVTVGKVRSEVINVGDQTKDLCLHVYKSKGEIMSIPYSLANDSYGTFSSK